MSSFITFKRIAEGGLLNYDWIQILIILPWAIARPEHHGLSRDWALAEIEHLAYCLTEEGYRDICWSDLWSDLQEGIYVAETAGKERNEECAEQITL